MAEFTEWESGIQGELSYWDQQDVVAELKQRAMPRELNSYVGLFVEQLKDPVIRILDVGSGPISTLGNRSARKKIELIPTDALGDEYGKMLAAKGICPEVPTRQLRAEEIETAFAAESFHIVTATNSLDHCQDPIKAIAGMLRVLKPDGFILLNHEANEGINENYEGFHFWNFSGDGRKFIIGNKDGANVVVNEVFKELALFQVIANANWVKVHIYKSDAHTQALDHFERTQGWK